MALSAKPAAPLRVLVADDEPDVARSLAEALALELGCHVSLAADGESAWAQVERHAFDAIVLDVQMPRLGGLDLARRLREQAATAPPMPLLVAVTGKDASAVIGEIEAAFPFAFSKPVDVAALAQALRDHHRGLQASEPARRFELGALTASVAADALPTLHRRGQALGFDHEGACVIVDADAAGLQRGLYRLLCAASDLIAGGSVLCWSASEVLADGSALLTVRIAAAGAPGACSFDEVAARLQLAPGDDGRACGPCVASGGFASLAALPGEGLLLSLERRWAPEQTLFAAQPQADAGGRMAWVAQAPTLESWVFGRRLRRLGWRVRHFDGTAGLQARLLQQPALPQPALVVVFDDGGTAPLPVLEARGDGMPPPCGVVVHPAGHGRSAAAPGWTVWRDPVPALELLLLTRRLLPRFERDGVPSPELPAPLQAPIDVLVVDDVEVNRLLAQALLAALDCTARTVQDGLDAVQACRRAPPDLVLMDVNMPVLGGLASTRHIRRLQRLGEMAPFAIVAATADDTEDMARRCLEAGMDAVLVKPLQPQALRDTLDRLAAVRAAAVA